MQLSLLGVKYVVLQNSLFIYFFSFAMQISKK